MPSKKNYYAKLLPKVTGIIVALILIALTGNFMYQSHLTKKYQDSELEATVLLDQRTLLEKLKQEIKEKTKVFNQTGLSSRHTNAEYLDVLASLIQKQVVLNSLNINPVLKELKNNEKVQREIKTIRITGESDEIETLNNYLLKIEEHILFRSAKIVLVSPLAIHKLATFSCLSWLILSR